MRINFLRLHLLKTNAMKTLFTILLLSVSAFLASQSLTIQRVYNTGSVTAGGININTVAYGNRLFTIHSEGVSVSAQKSDFDGVPVLKRHYSGISGFQVSQKIILNTWNGMICITACRTVINGTTTATWPFLMLIDTVNLNPMITLDYPVAGFNSIRINDAIVLNNGYLLMAGRAANTGTNAVQYGFFQQVNLSANGNTAGTATLSVAQSTMGEVSSLSQISGSSVIYAFNVSTGVTTSHYLGKLQRTNSSIAVLSAYNVGGTTDIGVTAYGNPKRVLFYNGNAACKVDTNLSLLVAPSPPVTGVQFSANTSLLKALNGKIYRTIPANKQMDVADTTLLTVTSTSYPFGSPASQFGKALTRNAFGSPFVYFSEGQTTANFYMIKPQPNGQSICASTFTATLTPFNLSAIPDNPFFGSVPATFVFQNPIAQPAQVQHTLSCFTSGLSSPENAEEKPKVTRIEDGQYNIGLESGIKQLQIYDVNGRIVFNEVYADTLQEIKVDVSPYTSGIYILRVQSDSGKASTLKLIN